MYNVGDLASYDEALALFRDVLDKRGQTSGPRSIDVAGAMRDVARVLTSLEQCVGICPRVP